MDSDKYDHGNDNCQKDPPAQLNALFKISNTGCHRSTIVDQLFVPIECQYASEYNHGSNGYHGCSDNDEIRMSNDEGMTKHKCPSVESALLQAKFVATHEDFCSAMNLEQKTTKTAKIIFAAH